MTLKETLLKEKAELESLENPTEDQKRTIMLINDRLELNGFIENPDRKVYNAEEFVNLEIPKPDFQVEGLMLDKGITILGGYQSTFKTHFSVYLALCLTNGARLFDKLDCKKSNVLYVNEELHAGAMQDLIKALSKGCNLEINKRLKIMNFSNWKIDNEEHNKRYLEVIEEHDIKFVIFDTFRECFMSAENSADEITNVLVNFVRPIIEKTGCSFLIIMHKGKAGANSQIRQSADLIRGSSMFRNYVDSIILLDRIRKTERVDLTHEKVRTAKELDNLSILWEFNNGTIKPKVMTEKELEKVLIDDCKKAVMEFVKKEDLQELETGKDSKIKKKLVDSKKFSNGTFYDSLTELQEEGKIMKIKRGHYEIIDRRLDDY